MTRPLLWLLFIVLIVLGAGVIYALRSSSNPNYKSPTTTSGTYAAPSGNAGVSATQTQMAIARSVPVLLYHGEGGAAANTPISLFTDQMNTLKKAGWQTITMSQFDGFMKGRLQLPDKSFLLTFDDGRKDSYYGADPVLKALDYNAIMFVITGFSLPDNAATSSFYLDRQDLQTMANSGRWELESHGKEDHRLYAINTSLSSLATTTPGHFLSNKFLVTDPTTKTVRFETDQEFTQRITNDLTLAKQTLEQDFLKPVIAFAYPYNDFGQDTVNFPGARTIIGQVVPSLYQYAFYQNWPANGDTFNYPDPNQYFVRRIEPGINWTGAQLLAALTEGAAKDLPYTSNTFGGDWVGTLGNVEPTNGALTLQASPWTTGAEALLNGSGGWRDYTFNATLEWLSGNNVLLIARRHDGNNYLSCSFSNTDVTLEKEIDGTKSELANASYALSGQKSGISFGISVVGDTATCYANNKAVVQGTASDPVLATGGIGIQTWDPGKAVASIRMNSVDVEQR
ncbi:MAG: polysaccharide deacetylase family protein [Minisyncoccota bacterium]